MKIILVIVALISLINQSSAQSLSREQVAELLAQRNISLTQLESRGSRLLLGEVTGAGKVTNDRIQVIVTTDQALLKNEIDSMDSMQPEVLQNLQSFRAQGTYFLKSDIKAVIVK
jgi:hypothetical protein